MTEPDIRARYDRYMAEQSNRGLGDISLRSTAALAPISRGQTEAATNLLTKAVRALDDDDEARAKQLVERAVALPYDDHEQVHPGASMACQLVFTEITETLEDCEDHWVSALADTFAGATPDAKFALRDVLTDILDDYNLTQEEQHRVRRLIRDVPERAELTDLDLAPPAMATAILEILDSIISFRDALDEIHDLEDDEE